MSNGARHRPAKRPAGNPARIGHYDIVERIGTGGMAETFRARARGPGGYEREVIIKSILPSLADDPEFVRLFVAEAKILGMLHHPNVVQVYDFGEHDGRHFLVLEYLDGPSLAQIKAITLKEKATLATGVVAFVGREMCLGLAAAHDLRGPDDESLRVVHRDISPSNVLITSGGEVKLVDFGIAKIGLSGMVTKAGTIRGKPAYLAPEQILSGQVDSRADIFATGVVLHEMLTLVPLFCADSDLGTIYGVLEKPIPAPSALRRDVPAALDKVIMRALERAPAVRYQSAAAMGADLSEVLLTCPVGRQEIAEIASTFIRLGQRRRGGPPSSVTPASAKALGEQPTADASSARQAARPPQSRSRSPERGHAD